MPSIACSPRAGFVFPPFRRSALLWLGVIILMNPIFPYESGAGGAAEAQPLASRIEARRGDLELEYGFGGGVLLSAHGIQMIRGSSLHIVKPGWTGHIYGIEDNPRMFHDAIVEKSETATTITLRLDPAGEPDPQVVGEQTITLGEDNSIRFRLAFRLMREEPAEIEWGVAQIASAPLLGAPCRGEDARGAFEGVIPVTCASAEIEKSAVARGLRRLEIETRLGPVVIEANEAANLLFFDYRKNRWAQEDKPIFWLGHFEGALEPGREYLLEATLRFPPRLAPVSETAGPVVCAVSSEKISRALLPSQKPRPLIPTPKLYRATPDRMALGAKTRIYTGEAPAPEIERALAFFLRDLKELYEVEPLVLRENAPARPPKGSILLGAGAGEPQAAAFCDAAGLEPPASDEGYRLRVTRECAAVAAPNPRALFYGLTTLAQRIEVDEKGVALRGAEIADYPTLAFRGIHCHSSKPAPEEIIRATRELMGRFKINTLVFECSYMIWDGHPEIAHSDFGMAKEDGRRILQAARENFLEVIPLVQSLGHCEWIFTNGQNLDIAEDPETPYAYCPTNPRSYEFIFSVYQEALDLFQPRVFHIGHDEVSMTGRFPYRSLPAGKSAAELLIEDTLKLHAWFKERNVRVMLWGDMFLAPGESPDATHAPSREESAARRAALPRDAFIADWHYEPQPPESFRSLRIWREEGFDVVGASWFNPLNIRNLSQAAAGAGANGLLQTTWAGYNFQINDNEAAWYQYMMYIYAAHCAWSGDTTPYDQLPWNVRDVFLDTWFARKPLLHPRAGFQIDLSGVANRSLTDGGGGGGGWLGFGPALDLADFPAGQMRFGATAFRIGQNARGDRALLLAGALNPPGRFPELVELRLHRARKAAEIHFLAATAFPGRERAKAGSVALVYDDGSVASLDLLYGVNIFGWTENRVGRDARIAWSAVSESGERRYLWNLAWANPHPEKKITALRLSSTRTEAAPVFFAITGIEGE